jgi:hypothetical protein
VKTPGGWREKKHKHLVDKRKLPKGTKWKDWNKEQKGGKQQPANDGNAIAMHMSSPNSSNPSLMLTERDLVDGQIGTCGKTTDVNFWYGCHMFASMNFQTK